LNEPLPTLTYHFKEGYELVNGDTLFKEPTLYAEKEDTSVSGFYFIYIEGGEASENYIIMSPNEGVLSVGIVEYCMVSIRVFLHGNMSYPS